MASEFFAEGGKDVAIKITPGGAGSMQVYGDGDKIFDKMEDDGQMPTLPRVKEMRAIIRDRLGALVTADD